MTSNDPLVKHVNSKNKLKRGAKIEIDDLYLDENFQYNCLKMESAMHFIANDQIVKSETVQAVKNFNS